MAANLGVRIMKKIKILFAAFLGTVFILGTGCEGIYLPDHYGSSQVTTDPVSVTETYHSIQQTENPDTAETRDPNAEPDTQAASAEPDSIDDPAITIEEQAATTEQTESTWSLKVHFIDVGQGDSCFIELPNGETMLIDAGEREYGDSVVTYIFTQGYGALDYVVATHPHSDHIGGMAEVLNALPVGELFMSPYPGNTTAFEDMLTAAENNDVPVQEVMAGDMIFDADGLRAEVVAPKELADNSNNNSVVVKLTYGENSFLFTGDAEKKEEDGIWTNIKCDVLKIGHHGSKTSTSANFLKKVEPEYAVISCGSANRYGHPDDVVLQRLDRQGISVFRTDIQGTIVFTSDGKDITADREPVPYSPPETLDRQTADH